MAEQPYASTGLTIPGGFTAGIEGPACDRDGNIYAVNYLRQGTIGRVTPGGQCEVFLQLPPGSIGNGIRFSAAGEMYIADYVGHAIYRVAAGTREPEVYARDQRLNQPNDIAIDRAGYLYASDPDWSAGGGQIWRVGPERRFELLEGAMGTTNGIEVGPDEQTLYVNETMQRRIWSYDLTPGGRIDNKRLFAAFSDHMLDGMRCDIAGNLYVTRYGKGTVACLSPQGETVREIALHGRNPTNLTFGGLDGRTCYVTVADTGQIEQFRTEIPGRCWSLWRATR
ncbi:MAG: hypothetical protein RLZZ387_4838 [Chloroflexota bacterium]